MRNAKTLQDTNEIGSTGLQVTTLGLGSAPLGGLFSHVGTDEAIDTVQTAVNMGINYISKFCFNSI